MNLSYTIGRMDPAGFEPASTTMTECRVAITLRALNESFCRAIEDGKVNEHNLFARVQNWDENLRCRHSGVPLFEKRERWSTSRVPDWEGAKNILPWGGAALQRCDKRSPKKESGFSP